LPDHRKLQEPDQIPMDKLSILPFESYHRHHTYTIEITKYCFYFYCRSRTKGCWGSRSTRPRIQTVIRRDWIPSEITYYHLHDNMSCIASLKTKLSGSKLRHVKVNFQFVKECISNKQVESGLLSYYRECCRHSY
jgi:hypothetical protein